MSPLGGVSGRSIFAALLARLWRQHHLILLALVLAMSAFQFVITRVAPLPGETGFLGGIVALLPSGLSAVINEQLSLASSGGVIALGYMHPFFLAVLSAWTIRIGAGALAGEIGRGTMDVMASRPIARWWFVAAAWIAVAAGLAIILAAAWTASSIGLGLRPLGIGGAGIWKLPAMAWLFFAGWAGITLAIGATRREAGPVIAWASGLIATSFALAFLARLWQPVAWTRWLSLFTYYTPQEIIVKGVTATDLIVLTGVAVISLSTAVVMFQRRDL